MAPEMKSPPVQQWQTSTREHETSDCRSYIHDRNQEERRNLILNKLNKLRVKKISATLNKTGNEESEESTYEVVPSKEAEDQNSMAVSIDNKLTNLTDSIKILSRNVLWMKREWKKMETKYDEIIKIQKKIRTENQRMKEKLFLLKPKEYVYEVGEGWLKRKQLKLPLQDVEELNRFSSLLKKKHNCRLLTTSKMNSVWTSQKGISKNLVVILRKFLARELAMGLTAVKPSPEKTVFSKTYFYKYIFDYFLMKSRKNEIAQAFNAASFNRALGDVLSNAASWRSTS